ncbi:MAG: hypothetical protein FWG10_14700 [Eubacteriaceae bacterium]|nr:hypothetical protein [Eubacteriaceae bacterium]
MVFAIKGTFLLFQPLPTTVIYGFSVSRNNEDKLKSTSSCTLEPVS